MTAMSVTKNLDPARPLVREARRPGLWARLRHAMANARLERSEREIASFLQQNGGRLTDQLERRILDRAAGLDRPSMW